MAPESQTATRAELAAASSLDASSVHAHSLHAPSPGATATLIHDLRELFKVKVVGLVLVTGWGGFYLGSMQSGIIQPAARAARYTARHRTGFSRRRRAEPGAGAHHRRKDEAHRRPAAGFGPFPAWPRALSPDWARWRLGALWLLLHTNLLTVSLALLTAFTYVAIYTPLKRVTTLATFIGAFPGAMGPMLGWTAARGRIEWPAVALFAILFVWQFPHFMSIAWLYREDYARAGIRMLPVVQPDGWSTVVEALFYAVLMIPVSLAPWRLGMAGAGLRGDRPPCWGWFTWPTRSALRASCKRAAEDESRMLARDLLKVSVLYLPLLFTALMLCANASH